MSTTKPQQKTISDVSETETTQIDLRALVAQTTGNTDALPDWQQFDAACKCSLETVRRLAEDN